MNNDEVFEAEAGIEAEAEAQLRVQQSHSSIISRISVQEVADERSPLLAHSTTSNTSPSHASDEQGHEVWSESGGDFAGFPWWKKPSIWWLLPPFTLLSLSYGGTVVPKIEIILTLICRNHFAERATVDPTFHFMPVIQGEDNPQCRVPEVQSLVSTFTLYMGVITGLLSAIANPNLGVLSDRYGRLRALVLPTIGMLISEAIFIAVVKFQDTLSINFVLLAAAFEGAGGSFIFAMAVSYAYATDCTPPARRNTTFGFYHGCLFTGLALGPLFAGYIVRVTNNMLSIFYIAIVSHLVFFSFMLFIVPESLSKRRQMINRQKAKKQAEEDAMIVKSPSQKAKLLLKKANIFAPLTVLWPVSKESSIALRRNLFCLAAVDTIVFGVAMGAVNILLIYSNYAFGWGNFQTSVYVTVTNSCRVVALFVILPLISRMVRGRSAASGSAAGRRIVGSDTLDVMIIRFSILFDFVGFIGYATARTGGVFILCGVLTALGGMASPTLQSALTKHVPPEQTGQVLGAMGLLHSSARVVAPIIFNQIYSRTVESFTQMVFVCLAGAFAVAFGFAWGVRPHVPLTTNDDDEEEVDTA